MKAGPLPAFLLFIARSASISCPETALSFWVPRIRLVWPYQRRTSRPTMRWRVPMRQLILPAFAVLSLTAGTASVARAYTTGFVYNAYQSGQYDNFSYG